MKKINSIWFGTTMLKWASILIILIPVLLFIFGSIFRCIDLILIPIYVNIGLGSILLISLSVILAVELKQDKKINSYYQNHRDLRIALLTGYFECQNCGHTKVKINDKYCLICGVSFRNKLEIFEENRSIFKGGHIMTDQKQKVNLEMGRVEESLFIPLIVKAKESKRIDSLFMDSKSEEIINNINLDFNRFDGGNIAYHGILVRTTILDSIVNDFIKKNSEGIILNLGAGLDTRIHRINYSKIYWYDIDLPEVIELRRMFFEESERIRFISKSLLDLSWVNAINIDLNKPVLIIAEGLLMYFTESELKTVLNFLVEKFPNAEMCFDVVHKYFVGKGISSKFKWGIEKANEIEHLNSKIRLVKQWSVGDYHKNRQALFFRIINVFQSTRNRSQVLLIKCGQDKSV